MDDAKRYAPATARNREAIAAILAKELPDSGLVLEVASGSGEHALFFAEKFPDLQWQPSDSDASAILSIAAWKADHNVGNLCDPVELNAATIAWPRSWADALFCANMVHIAPWAAAKGLFAGSMQILAPGAPIILYGPYFERDVDPAPSNLAFDESLKSRNPDWGIRRLEDMDDLGTDHGFARTARYSMPANNLVVVYRKV